MRLIVGAGGAVSPGGTADAIRLHFFAAMVNFGHIVHGAERAGDCAACQRRLPTACLEIDHISPQVHAPLHGGFGAVPVAVEVVDEATPNVISTNFAAVQDGTTINVVRLGAAVAPSARQAALPRATHAAPHALHTAWTVDLDTAWKLNLRNLQYLCPECNRGKGGRPMAVAFPGRPAQPFA